MNQTELSTELESWAADATSGDGMARIVGVRRRIRNRRRARAGGGAVAVLVAAACAIGFGVVPALPGTRARAVPPSSSLIPPPLVPSDPLTFAPDLDGDPRAAVVTGAPGVSELSISFTPTDTNLMLSGFCRIPVAPGGTKTLWAQPIINGHVIENGGTSCSDGSAPGEVTLTPDDDPAKNRADWARWGVVPGHRSVLRVRLQTTNGAVVTNPSVQLGDALYVLSGDRVRSNGVVIKVDASSDGHAYRLVGYRTLPISRRHRTLTLNVPADRVPSLLLDGTPGATVNGPAEGVQTLRVSGQSPQSDDTGITVTGPLPDAGAHTVTLSIDPASGDSGTLVLAFYQRVD